MSRFCDPADEGLQLWRALAHAAHAVRRKVRKSLREHGIRGSQFAVLMVLAEAGPEGMKLSDIGEKLGVTGGNITGLIDRLEETEYVVRAPHPSDRRAYLARLTPKAHALLDEIVPIQRERLRRIMACLSDEERHILVSLLNRLTEHTNRVDEELERDEQGT